MRSSKQPQPLHREINLKQFAVLYYLIKPTVKIYRYFICLKAYIVNQNQGWVFVICFSLVKFSTGENV
jgi:hypothetical protein